MFIGWFRRGVFVAQEQLRPNWTQVGMLLVTLLASAAGIVFSAASVDMQNNQVRRQTRALARKVSATRAAQAVRLAVALALLKKNQEAHGRRLMQQRDVNVEIGRQLKLLNARLDALRTIRKSHP